MTKPIDDPITLDDILNIWDGIQETPGRIMIISSNHYDKLDPALVRPGRIDITLEMKNASHDIIAQMFQKYYNKPINKTLLKTINNDFYSPAEIINFYLLHKNDSKKFMERLLANKK
jgi:SpoVK/Ycf46/Vps4 family AAA+-type ATPase